MGCQMLRSGRSDSSPGLQITIATSIFPERVAQQKEALASWQQLGFDVISVNVTGELGPIKHEFPAVTFVEVDRGSDGTTGKPYIYLNEILSVLATATSPICGIVNSDVRLIAHDDFFGFISDQAADSVVFGSRTDTPSHSDLCGQEDKYGFDYFFFDKKLITIYPESDFCLGMPCWDYWFPLVPLLRGVTVKQLVTPVAYHTVHEGRWGEEFFEEYGVKLVDSLKSGLLGEVSEEDSLRRLNKSLQNPEMWRITEAVRDHIIFKADNIFYANPHVTTKMVTISLDRFQEMKSNLITYENKLFDYEERFETIINSRSWRITEPLRYLSSKLRGRSNKMP